MAATAFKKTDLLSLAAYAGDAKTLLAWDLPKARSKNLSGFTIECRPPGRPAFFLKNMLRFEHLGQHAQVATESANSSVNAPFHKFRWLHVPGAAAPDGQPVLGRYRYTVTPRYFDANGALQPLDPSMSIAIDIKVAGFEKGSVELAFTRGYVQSQAYTERFGPKALIRPKDKDLQFDTSQLAGTSPAGKPFTFAEEYAWLGFTARRKIFALLDELAADPGLRLDMFAYDLSEPDLVGRLLTLAKEGRVRMILDNAALHHNTSDDKTKDKPEDELETRFAKAAKKPAEIRRGRFGRYAHDKVLIVSDANGPVKVLTGSTNFSVTGFYVNSNHILVFTDKGTAAEYGALFQQVWDEQVKAPAFRKSARANAPFSPARATVPAREITFAPHTDVVAGKILDAIAARIAEEDKAKKPAIGNVLFAVMDLGEGSGPIYPALNNLHAQQTIFSFGISDDPDGISLYAPGKPTGVLVTGKPKKARLPPPFNQVPAIGLGHQIHHKFVICGLNGPDPVVYCGSSNLALGGEKDNGDNLIEIHDADVAAAFALEALALVDHFQFLNGVAVTAGVTKPPPASKPLAADKAGWFLSTTDGWAKRYFDPNDLRCIDRLLFAGPSAAPAA